MIIPDYVKSCKLYPGSILSMENEEARIIEHVKNKIETFKKLDDATKNEKEYIKALMKWMP